MSTSKIGIDIDSTGQWLVLRTPFSRDFVDELKARYARGERRWVHEQKTWEVARYHWSDVRALCRKHFPESEIVLTSTARQAISDVAVDAAAPPELDSYATLGVRVDAPPCVIHAAYAAIEAAWETDDDDRRSAESGLFPLAEVRRAYAEVCAHRKISSQAKLFFRGDRQHPIFGCVFCGDACTTCSEGASPGLIDLT